MNRTEMRRCGKQYASEWAALNSRAWEAGMDAVRCPDPRCGCWHLRKPAASRAPIARSATPKVTVPAPRAPRGHMRAAVAMVLAGADGVTLAKVAAVHDVDRARLRDEVLQVSRGLALERDGYGCASCGRSVLSGPYSLQHRVARGRGGSSQAWMNTPVNLVTLCGSATTPGSCHLLAERRDQAMYDRGFWMWSTEDPAAKPVYVHAEYAYLRTWLLPDGTASLTEPRELAA